jgi:3-oxoacyl-[acyl-carrier protein] reductase
MTLQERVAVVTGGGQGIGRAIALELARRGARILINDVREDIAAQTVQMIKDLGSDAVFVLGDVSKAQTGEAIVQAATERWGRLDILVNNAGVTRDNLLMRMKEEDWDLVLTINLKSAFLLSKAVVRPMMKQRWGRIINISSIVGVIGNAGQVNYSASKAGLIGLTKTLAKELASRNILVNAVAPGFIRTAMTDALNEEQKKALSDQIPLTRLGEVEDVARVVAFLASEDSAYVTGQVLQVTGGLGM